MSLALWLLSIAVLLLPIAYGLRRANELFVLAVHGSGLDVVRGRLPPALFADLEDVVARGLWPQVEIHVVSESGVPRLTVKGGAPSEDHRALEQAGRNVLGRFSVAQIRLGRRGA